MQAIILAGGYGTRLKPYSDYIPKPMFPLGHEPILEHTIKWLKKYKIKEIVISSSYLSEDIKEYFKDGKNIGVNITHITSKRPLGTAGQLKRTEKVLKKSFIALYGDSIFNFSISKALKYHNEKKSFLTMVLNYYETTFKYGFIKLDNRNKIKEWDEKPIMKGLINTGFYIMNRNVMEYIPKNRKYEMNSLIYDLIKQKKNIYGYTIKNDIIDIGNKDAYSIARRNYMDKRVKK